MNPTDGGRRLLVRDLKQLATAARRSAPLRGSELAEVDVIEDAYVLCADGSIEGVGRMRDLPSLDGEVEEIDGCRLRDGTDAVLRSLRIYKPIIAAVDGPCVAGGMEMLGGTDIRLATERATFGVMEPRRGLFAGGGTTVRLPRQLAYPAAMEFLLTAEAFPAGRAYELGLLNEIVPGDELASRALDWARRITVNAPLAVQATKESVLRGLAVDQREAYRIEDELAARIFASEDAEEGPRAFAEKRPPQWRGR